MAVYTDVSLEAAQPLFQRLNLGTLTQLRGIQGGIENTNYFATTDQGEYVLTLFERLTHEQLPYYLYLMQHLAKRGIPVPLPASDAEGEILFTLCGKPGAVVEKLRGSSQLQPQAVHCSAVGSTLARMHLVGQDFNREQPNLRGLPWWNEVAPLVYPHLNEEQTELLRAELAYQNHVAAGSAYAALPRGPIHADLFRDNVLWDRDEDGTPHVGGLIDFYFAGYDALLFDVAVTVNDWCSQPDGQLDPARTRALLDAYHAERPFTAEERAAWPAMLRAAALRFWLSRAADFHRPRSGEMVSVKTPDEYRDILRLRAAGVPPLPL